MKTVSEATFKFYCRKVRYWLKQFGEIGWTVYFSQEAIGEYAAAEVRVEAHARGLTFVLPLSMEDTSRRSVDHSAIHEVTHAVVTPLETLAKNRYATEEQIDDAVEELVCKITYLISNLSKPTKQRE